ncbi:MAG: FHA domain-containing protein [Anaerolinea sp.]|nr:FHA domain-containing protein [Anaerolinea sp.]
MMNDILLEKAVNLMLMSGVDDGMLFSFAADNGEGSQNGEGWTLSIGRKEDNDVCLRNDTFSSRYHAKLHWRNNRWWLEDLDSKNGTYLEGDVEDERISGLIPLEYGQLFRVGRTWMRIQAAD